MLARLAASLVIKSEFAGTVAALSENPLLRRSWGLEARVPQSPTPGRCPPTQPKQHALLPGLFLGSGWMKSVKGGARAPTRDGKIR